MKDQATVMHTYIKEMANFLVSGHSLWKFPRERSSSNNSSTAATNADGAGIDDEKYEMYLGITEGLEVYLTTKLFDIIFPPASPKKKSELIEDSDLKKKISSHWFVSAKHLDIKIER